MFKVGDVVRLNKGWTPMVVLHVDEQSVWAMYACRYEQGMKITQEHYKRYREFYSYRRSHSGFTKWSGEPINRHWNHIMPKTYRMIENNNIEGTYLSTTSEGKVILETKTGDVWVCRSDEIEEVFPKTFAARNTHGGNLVHFEMPELALDLCIDDLILSKDNKFYTVEAFNTKARNNAGVFVGRRIFTQLLQTPKVV